MLVYDDSVFSPDAASVSPVSRAAFTVDGPSFIGLVGRVGAGKSALLRRIAGGQGCDGGVLRYCGGDLTGAASARAAWRADCTVLAPGASAPPGQQVLTGLLGAVPGAGSDQFTTRDLGRALDCLRRFGLMPLAQAEIAALAPAERFRLELARAVMQYARVILADDPCAGMAPPQADCALVALRTLQREEGCIVIATFSTFALAARHCDRIIGLREGRVVHDGAPDALDHDGLRKIYAPEDGAPSATFCASLQTLNAVSRQAMLEAGV